MIARLQELSDRWLLPLENSRVTGVEFKFAVSIHLDTDTSIRIEQPFDVETYSWKLRRIDPQSFEAYDELRDPLLGLQVSSADAFKDGRLEIQFVEDSTHLAVQPHSHYEAWEIVGPQGLRLISTPGGGLAVWPPGA